MMRFRLFFDGSWIAEGEGIRVSAGSLEELDSRIIEELRKIGVRGKVEVLYEFDIGTIPAWMRQFHQHYFNRRVVARL